MASASDTYLQALKDTQTIYNENFEYQLDKRIVKNKHIEIPQIGKKIVPAVCINIRDELDKLYSDRRKLFLEYKMLEDKIVLSDINIAKQYKGTYDDIIKKINDIQDKIEVIHEYYDKVEEVDSSYENKIKNIRSILPNLHEDIPRYVKKMRELRKLEKNYEDDIEITYIVTSIPKVIDIKTRIDKKPKQAAAIPAEDVKTIKKNIKQLIKEKLKPKNLEECASQKRSADYFMKKEDILETIDSNPEIKTILPANFKSLTKQDLCKHLFE